jgi:hypothetical protein
MDKKPLIVVSICAVVLLLLGSLSTVVGYQSVQTSQQNFIKERINQRELLFQTIVDIANNKEIQRIILKSQMSRGIFPTSEFPVVTKNQIRQMYFLGLILSKFIGKSRIQPLVGKYQFNNQEIQTELSSVIEKDTTLNAEITKLKDSECDCENENTTDMTYPIICTTIILVTIALSAPWAFFYYILFNILKNPVLKILSSTIALIIEFIATFIFVFFGFLFQCFDIPYPYQI